MANLLKKTFIIFAFSLVIVTVVKANEFKSETIDYQFDNYDYIEQAKLASSRYTKPDDLSIVDPTNYVKITSHDDLIADNANYELYYNRDIVSFKVLDKITNYVWSTAIDDPDAGTYTGLLSSGIGIEYILKDKDMFIEENIGIAETVFSAEEELTENGINLSLSLGGYCSTRTCTRLYDAYLDGRYTLEEMKEFGFTEINIGFDLQVTLTDSGIEAHIPYESITEGNDNILLSSIILFPGLGATKMDHIPGYMVIPDGSGALIRYENNHGKFNAPFEEYYFGKNYGLSDVSKSNANYNLTMPIYGAVHGVNQNAYIGIIEEGMLNARLFAYPNGAHNLDYNLIFPKFDFKQVYRQSFSSDGFGGALKYLNTSTSDIRVKFDFLKNQNANYVGIAGDYRDYLLELGNITRQSQSGDISIFMNYLMSDNENSFLGNSLVKMSTVNQVKAMYDYFIDQGILKQSVGLMGWNDGGFSGKLPAKLNFENKLGSNKSYRMLIDYISQDNRVLLLNDYIFASEDTSGISYRFDVAKGSNRFKMSFECESCVHNETYVLYPETSRDLAVSGYNDYVDENVEVLFMKLASILFSYYDSGNYNREDSYQYYLDVLEQYQGIGNYMYPYSYAFKYTKDFYETPLYNSQMKYYDDVVPLMQIVLKGSIDMYSSYLNYNSLGKETLLNLIDFGMNPAYILSHQPSSQLKETDLGQYYTTQYDLWNETIVSEYNYVNDALKYVNGEIITKRVVLNLGIVKVTYSNGVDIYINYTSNDYVCDSIIIPAFDYYLGGI